MGNYSDAKINSSVRIIEKVVEKNDGIDISAIVEKITSQVSAKLIENIEKNIRNNCTKSVQFNKEDDFDVTSTMDSLAKSMIVSRDESANFSNIGSMKVEEVNKAVDDTIDFLSKLDD